MSLYTLIVEDDHSMRIVIKQALLKMGLGIKQIYEAENGEEGLRMLKTYPIRLLLTDINMPVMNGLELLRCMKRDPALANVPTVVMSTTSDESIINSIIESGKGFIQKPFTPVSLKKQIQSLEGRYEAELQPGNL